MEWLNNNKGVVLIVIGLIIALYSKAHYSKRTGNYWRFFINLACFDYNAKEKLLVLIGLILVIIGVFI